MKSATCGTSPATIGGGQADHLMAELRQALAELATERATVARLTAEVERLRAERAQLLAKLAADTDRSLLEILCDEDVQRIFR